MSKLVPTKANEITDLQAQQVVNFLDDIGLPSKNIIAEASERQKIGVNLPLLVEGLPQEVKPEARYISKFVVGAAYGLFDYSLNAIWNEVVIDLRKKAVVYGLEIFFDSAVGGSRNREFYENEDDLGALKDAILLNTCRKLELISDTTFGKLKHMLDMRNHVGISHPTTYSIGAFELLGWLETCVNDVLNDQPSEAAIQIQAFVANLKEQTEPISDVTLQGIERSVSSLPSHMTGSLLRTVFGIYVSDKIDPKVRKNISKIAAFIWRDCLDEPKYKLGIVLEGYKTNLHTTKYDLGEQFFQIVEGNAFRSNSDRAIIVTELLMNLRDRHHEWDNFHHETPIAKSLVGYLPDEVSILPEFAEQLFRTILMCRIGNGVAYQNGVSLAAKPYYNRLLGLVGDTYTPIILASLSHFEIKSRLSKSNCRKQARIALEEIRKSVINERYLECIDYLIDEITDDPSCVSDTKFRKLSKSFIDWN